MSTLVAILLSALVAVVASPYLHVLIARTPTHLRLRVVGPHCTNCGTPATGVQAHALLAVARGKNACTVCSTALWRDAPRLEIATVALLAVVGWRLHLAWALPAYWVFFLAAVTIVMVDLRLYLIPTRVVYPTTLLGLVMLSVAAVITHDGDRLLTAVACMLGCWFFYAFFWFFFPSGMGFGDVRLSLMVGLFTGWLGVGNAVYGLMLGLVLGAVTGMVLVLLRLRKRKEAIPFAPFMLLGASLAILLGGTLRGVVLNF